MNRSEGLSATMLKVFLVSLLAVVLGLCTFSGEALAQMSTGNSHVTATVQDGTGWIRFLMGTSPAVPPSKELSFQNKSFLSLMVGGKVYSNNDGSLAKPDVFLGNGVNSKTGDTIETRWSESNGGFEIVQDVYPVDFQVSGQIVYKIKIVNHTGVQLSAQAQYLLDVEVDGNDYAKVLTRYNYTLKWFNYPNANHGVPQFFLGFKTPPELGSNDAISTGYTDDTFTPLPMGLMLPNYLAIVDWRGESDYYWGPRPSAPWGTSYGDNAILLQWPGTAASGSGMDTIREIARGSYGTGEFELCQGNFVAITFYPHRIVYDAGKGKYINNPFKVESLIFNTNSNTDAGGAIARQTVTWPLNITSPLPGGLSQAEGIGAGSSGQTGGTVASLDVAEASWTDSARNVINCTTDSTYYLNLHVIASGPFIPDFVNPSPCDMPIIVECTKTDIVPPKIWVSTPSDKFDSTFNITDSTLLDRGLKRMSWTFDDPVAGQTFDVIIGGSVRQSPVFFPCNADTSFTIRQKDSTKCTCLNFTFTDCHDNSSYRQVCFKCWPPAGHPDLLAPLFNLQGRYHRNLESDTTCNNQCGLWLVSDDRQYDKKVLSVTALAGSVKNMSLSVQNGVTFPISNVKFTTCVIDSMKDGDIIVVARDSNTPPNVSYDTIHYCTTPDVVAPLVTPPTLAQNTVWHIHATDTQSWDRGLGFVEVTSLLNAHVSAPGLVSTKINDTTVAISPTDTAACGVKSIDFDIIRNDTFNASCMTVRARDCWDNWSGSIQRCTNVIPDTMCPTITLDTLSGNPLTVHVVIRDIHPPPGGNFDLGIQRVNFRFPHNMTLIRPNSGIPNSTTFPDIVDTQTSVIPPYYPKTVEFEIKVTDQTVQDAQPACVTIDPVDGADNHLCNGRYQWCFPVVVDDLPPTILGANPTHSKLDVTINDNRTNDRGVGEVKIENVINFQSPYLVKPYDSVYSGTHSATLTLNVITKGKSAYARIWTIDSFGLRTNHILNHTDSADVWIYAQDLRLSHTPIILTPGTFYDSVYLTWTDSIPLSQKNLTQYNFGFQLVQLEGTPQVNFLGASTAGTLSQGWTVTPVTAPNRSYTITGISNGPALPDMPTAAQMAAKPLLILQFDAQASSSPGETILRINGTPGSEVAYNGGADSLYSGTNYSVTLAAPYGTLSGETLVAKGDCSPLVGVGGTPTEISLAPTTPNPAATSALVDYTVPAEGLVRLELYNTLGARIRTLVEQVQKQGEYRLDLLAGDLPQGTYFLRLESGGKVVSRQVVLGR